jgi:FtsP/CotA-like multicopper oxidase with cupredoxin domain
MSDSDKFTRRDFLAAGGIFTLGAGVAMPQQVQSFAASHSVTQSGHDPDFKEFSRFRPSFGGPPGNPNYLGKMVPGFRKPGQPPVPVVAPNTARVPFKMVNGVKEFRLTAMPVTQEFLPGYKMHLWGYNGSCPGPMIEAYQGDRVRIIVKNDLPEPTSMHWHGFELPIGMDGVPGLVQDEIKPGDSFAYEFNLHQTGTFFYHAHVAMQEALGMCGFFIVHPKIAFDPPVDRDFALCYQNFLVPPNADIVDTTQMDWNWHTINGRSGPYSTPMVVKHGERVRVRLMNFSPMQHHPIHFHGHTFWLTGTEGGRIPHEAWTPRNNTLVGVAMVQDFEFVANNPGDWIFHCHMVHHMMNHMVRQSGPRIRPNYNIKEYMDRTDLIPEPVDVTQSANFKVPGYPQGMLGMMASAEMSLDAHTKINAPRETKGMRKEWLHGVKGLMTVLRVLPEPYYSRVMHSNEHIEPDEIYNAVAKMTEGA